MVGRRPEQAGVLAALLADVVAPQELTARTLPLWRASLEEAGLGHLAGELDGAVATGGRHRRRSRFGRP